MTFKIHLYGIPFKLESIIPNTKISPKKQSLGYYTYGDNAWAKDVLEDVGFWDMGHAFTISQFSRMGSSF
jgi:hypothetical protein